MPDIDERSSDEEMEFEIGYLIWFWDSLVSFWPSNFSGIVEAKFDYNGVEEETIFTSVRLQAKYIVWWCILSHDIKKNQWNE